MGFGIVTRSFIWFATNRRAIELAVYQANRYIPDRFLPDKAIDLIDEAGARVKLLQDSLPKEMTEIQKKIKIIVSHMEIGHLRTMSSTRPRFTATKSACRWRISAR